MSQRKARRWMRVGSGVDAINTTVSIGVFLYTAVLAVFEGLTGRWVWALVFLVVSLVNLQGLRVLRNAIKRRRESEARLVELDAYIAAYENRQDPEARP